MDIISVYLPEAYLKGIEKLVNAKMYPNRSECVRIAVRDLLKAELPLIPQPESEDQH